MNDYRGITSAYQYGDSYLVLKELETEAHAISYSVEKGAYIYKQATKACKTN